MQMAPDYDHLTLMQKVEVFEHAVNNTAGDDLAKLLWLKSPSSEVRAPLCPRAPSLLVGLAFVFVHGRLLLDSSLRPLAVGYVQSFLTEIRRVSHAV